jgi:hypothetical protein
MARPSLRQAINAFCKECIFDKECGLGSWRVQVHACTAKRCPLYPVRPLASKGERLLAAEKQAVTAPGRRSK